MIPDALAQLRELQWTKTLSTLRRSFKHHSRLPHELNLEALTLDIAIRNGFNEHSSVLHNLYWNVFLPQKIQSSVWGRSPGADPKPDLFCVSPCEASQTTSNSAPIHITTWGNNRVQKALMSVAMRSCLRNLLKQTVELLEKYNIRYWITGGTLLGAVRHNGFIPWDDDVDLCVDETNEARLWDAFHFPFRLEYNPYVGYKVYCDHVPSDLLSQTCYGIFIDLFMMSPKNEGFYALSRESARNVWPEEFWKKEILFPLRRYSFEGLSLWGPANALRYIKKMYGGNALEIGVIPLEQHGRRLGECISHVPVSIIPSYIQR